MPPVPLIPPNPNSGPLAAWPFQGAQSLTNPVTLINGAPLTLQDGQGNSLVLTPASATVARGAVLGTLPTVIGVQNGPPATTQFYLQCGTTVQATNGSGIMTVTMPVAFPTGINCVVVSFGDNNLPGWTIMPVNASFTAQTFNIAIYSAAGSSGGPQTVRCNYIAIGS